MARLAISQDFLTEYAKLDKRVQRSVDQAIATFARHPHPAQYLEIPQHADDDQLRVMPLDGPWRGIVLAPATGDTYCLLTVLPHHNADACVSGSEGLQLILAQPFVRWRTFLHPDQRQIAYHPGYSGPAQVTGGPGTGKTVTVLHRAAFLAERSGPILVTTFAGNLAEALQAQLDLLIHDPRIRRNIEILNVDRLAYRIVKQARGTPVIADERTLRPRWVKAATETPFTPAFLKSEWEQVILAQDLRTEPAYLTCARIGRGRPLTKAQRSQVWPAAQQVAAEIKPSARPPTCSWPTRPPACSARRERWPTATSWSTRPRTCTRPSGACSAPPSRPALTTCSSRPTRTSASTTTGSRWPASGSACAAGAAGCP